MLHRPINNLSDQPRIGLLVLGRLAVDSSFSASNCACPLFPGGAPGKGDAWIRQEDDQGNLGILDVMEHKYVEMWQSYASGTFLRDGTAGVVGG